MRSERAIQDRIRFLLTKELDRRVHIFCERLPCNCRHNHKQSLDTRKEVSGEFNENYNRLSGSNLPVIGFCLLDAEDPTQWKGNICEDPIDAQRCLHFDLVATKDSVSREFQIQIKDLKWVEKNLPEVYGLLWSLGSETMPSLPWWKALWFWFVRIRPDPLSKHLVDF